MDNLTSKFEDLGKKYVLEAHQTGLNPMKVSEQQFYNILFN